jgi:hypothetical protein
MNYLMEISIIISSIVLCHAEMFFTSFLECICMPDSGIMIAFSLGVVAYGSISETITSVTRRWHGSINNKYSNIHNLVELVLKNQPVWQMPNDMLNRLVQSRDELQVFINKCRTSSGSPSDRNHRDSLMKSTVNLCLLEVRIWAFGQFANGIMTADDVHLLGFLLPGESRGRHERTGETDVIAQVKVKTINEDFIRVVIDQSSGENSANVAHGWPHGVRNALIVIMADDGKTEIFRQMTTRLHNDIRMPEGSHGKIFIIKASFLKHINDKSRFGNEQTFSMPLTTADLVAALNSRSRTEHEEYIREIERMRQEIERLHDELRAK